MIFKKPIFTASKENIKNIDCILDLINEHKSYLPRYKENMNYYLGNHRILYRTMKDPSKPNNQLMENLPEYVVSVRVGYFSGEDIAFTSKDEELDMKINEVLKECYFNNINSSLDEISSIFGHAYLMLWIDEDGYIKMSAESPESCFIVYSNTLDRKALAGIRYFHYEENNKEITDVYVYLEDELIVLRDNQIIDTQPNYFGGVPVIEFCENNHKKGSFEDAISIVDAYESVLSSSINEIEYFDNAYLALTGVQGTQPEEITKMKENRVLLLPDEAKAEFLTKTINDTYIQNTLDRLRKDFHKITKTPDLSSDDAFGSNISGTALKFKLFSLEKAMALKEQHWTRSLMLMLKLIVYRLNMLGGSFNYRDINLTFTRALPTNTLEQAQMVSQLASMVSNETLISQLDFISNPKEEVERLSKEKEINLGSYNFENEEVDINE